MNNSDFIAKFLSSNGYNTAFGVTGGGAMFLNEAFRKNKNINFIFTHHEQSAAMAAEAYCRIKKKTWHFIYHIWSRWHKRNYRSNRSLGGLNTHDYYLRSSGNQRYDIKIWNKTDWYSRGKYL